MTKVAGWLLVLYGAAHTLGALFALGAARHAAVWFGGGLWHDDLAAMSPANSALWLTLFSFGPTLVVLGLLVLWLDRRGIAPPLFLGWTMAVLTVIDAVIMLFTPWPIHLLASILLVIAAHRARRRGTAAPAV